jgi:DNA-binding CsgD family transcriptional regulator
MCTVGLLCADECSAHALQRALAPVIGVNVRVLSTCDDRSDVDVVVTDSARSLTECGSAKLVLLTNRLGAPPDRSAIWAALMGVIHNSTHTAPPGLLAGLSPRELQVLDLIADGLTQGQTARRLGISPHTVDTYVKRMKGKLGIASKAELIRAAMSRTDALPTPA